MAQIPTELKYTKTHEWLRVEGEIATVGITDFAQQELSDIVYVEITAVGNIEAVKATSDIYAPLSGEVTEANPQINKQEGEAPAIVNRDPYGLGWLCKIKFTNPTELSSLLDHESYANLMQKSQHH